MKKVILAGNSVTADILYDYLASDMRYTIIGLVVDDEYAETGSVKNFSSTIPLSKLKDTHLPTDCVVIMAMGYSNLNKTRESMFYRLKEMGYRIETYIHPDARVYSHIPIGEGAVVLPLAVIEPHAAIGDNSMVWCHCTIGHHAEVGNHCWIASGTVIAGQSIIGRNSFLGVNATIVNDKRVGEYNLIGAGAIVTKDTSPSTVHLARSAEEIRYSSEDYVTHFGM